MTVSRCLVVDDDPELLQSVCDDLRGSGSTSLQHRPCIAQGGVDVVTLDVMLPDGDGLAHCRALRQKPETAQLPAIMLTAQGDPGSGEECRRDGRFAGWRFDCLRRRLVSPQQVVVPLSSAEYRLLDAFIERPRRVLTRDPLPDATRGQGVVMADRAIDFAVSRLRRKLSASDDGEQLIHKIRGNDCLFDADVKA